MSELLWVAEVWSLYQNPDNEILAEDIMRSIEKRVRTATSVEPKAAGFEPGCCVGKYRSITFPEFRHVSDILKLAGRYRKLIPWDNAGTQVLAVDVAVFPLRNLGLGGKGIEFYWPGSPNGASSPIEPPRLKAKHPESGEIQIEYSPRTKEWAKDLATSILTNRVLARGLQQQWNMCDAESASKYDQWCRAEL